MFVRIVKMSFQEDKIEEFLSKFENNRDKIRNSEGCRFLELYRDKKDSNIFFTYSYWESDAFLEQYRNSTLFKSVWAGVKPLFDAKPEAWSVDKVFSSESILFN